MAAVVATRTHSLSHVGNRFGLICWIVIVAVVVVVDSFAVVTKLPRFASTRRSNVLLVRHGFWSRHKSKEEDPTVVVVDPIPESNQQDESSVNSTINGALERPHNKNDDNKLEQHHNTTTPRRMVRVIPPPYSLGLQSYHSTSNESNSRVSNLQERQQQQRPMVTYFSDDFLQTPYTLKLQSNNQIVAQRSTPQPQGSINNKTSTPNDSNQVDGLMETRVVRFSVRPEDHASSNTRFPTVLLDPTNVSSTTTTAISKQEEDFTLPIPFAPPNRVPPVSLAENIFFQLAPTLVNVSAPLVAAAWNTSTMVSSSIPVNVTSMTPAAFANFNVNATASLAESLAESLLQFMEEAVQQPSNEIMNLTARLGSQAASQVGSSLATTVTALNVSVMDPKQQQQTASTSSTTTIPVLKPMFSVSSSPLLAARGKNLTEALTLEDLEFILQANGYVKQSDLPALTASSGSESPRIALGGLTSGLEGVGQPVSSQKHALQGNQKETVAFPQPSVLSYESLKWGTTISSGFLIMIASIAIAPNLWLVGMLGGAFYGYDMAKQLPVRMPKSLFPRILVRVGSRCSRTFLQAYDFVIALVFMWKTGVLSYEYWKQYATLDKRFGIQDKVDAWNARFIEGKQNFDKWEKENEVGRKVLATLRTVWLVEERSLKKGMMKMRRGQSRYRVIQILYDCAYQVGKFIGSLVKLVTGESIEWTEFWRGLRVEWTQARRAGGIGSRVGAVVAAVVAVQLMGALFTLSSTLLVVLAAVTSLIWPTWVTDGVDRWNRFLQETRALGREQDGTTSSMSTRTRQKPPQRRNVDKRNFHFYIRDDGTKRYYRKGKPIWPWLRPKKEEKKKFGFLGLK